MLSLVQQKMLPVSVLLEVPPQRRKILKDLSRKILPVRIHQKPVENDDDPMNMVIWIQRTPAVLPRLQGNLKSMLPGIPSVLHSLQNQDLPDVAS
jgi:hypothetical protein